MAATTVATPRPPRIRPTIALAMSMTRCMTPPRDISSPARMKSGIDISGKLSIEYTTLPESCTIGKPPTRMPAIPAMPSANAIGIPVREKKMKTRTVVVIMLRTLRCVRAARR